MNSKVYFMLPIFIFVQYLVLGQSATMNKAKDSDPKAKMILDKLKKQYDTYKSMEVKFEIDLELPGKAVEKQKGTVIQDGKKYQVKLQDQEIFADGKTIWVYLKKNKEVQITDMEEGEASAFMSPKQMMTMYDSGEFVYSIVEERKVGDAQFVDIEFKPLSKKTDYTKMRLTIDKKANKMVSLRVFSRDGSKYTLKVSEITPNKKYDSTMFTFNTKSVQGIHIEDLRMN
ncbi:MAG: outer membrane lipoprotein carrier protein LolA [Saprospiraceae bacterium]|nr:outer membrane lipoprotein carrier protein LolA [Saprospiraceae bacterium]